MSTTMSGARELRLSGSNDERNMVASVPVPAGFHGGKVLLPAAANEFTTYIEQTLVIGTAVTLAALVSGQVPVLMGLSAFGSTVDTMFRIRNSLGSTIFAIMGGHDRRVDIIFSPLGFVSSNVEHSLQVIQTSGVGQPVFVSAWGYYATAPA